MAWRKFWLKNTYGIKRTLFWRRRAGTSSRLKLRSSPHCPTGRQAWHGSFLNCLARNVYSTLYGRSIVSATSDTGIGIAARSRRRILRWDALTSIAISLSNAARSNRSRHYSESYAYSKYLKHKKLYAHMPPSMFYSGREKKKIPSGIRRPSMAVVPQ